MIDTVIKALPEWTLEAWFYLALMSPFIIALLYAVCLFIVSAFKKSSESPIATKKIIIVNTLKEAETAERKSASPVVLTNALTDTNATSF